MTHHQRRLPFRRAPSGACSVRPELNHEQSRHGCYLLTVFFVVSKQLGSRYPFEMVTIFGFSSLIA